MIKRVLNIIGFILFFCLLFYFIQSIFILKDNSSIAITQFFNEPENTFDVLMVGSSDMRTAMRPAVLWQEAGIPSYNLAIDGRNEAASYFLFKDALRFQTPKVVLVSITALTNDPIDFDESETESRLRQTLDSMRWSIIKFDAVTEVVTNSEKQTFLSYLFPFLRYHDRRDLTRDDLSFSYKRQRNLHMGAIESNDLRSVEQHRPDNLIETEYTGDIDGIYDQYLIRIFDLCKENNIEVILVDFPICIENRLTTSQHLMFQNYADKHGIRFLDLNNPDVFNAMNLDASKDFYDNDHVNIVGGKKVSAYMAQYLQEVYNLPDYRNTSYDPHWDNVTQAFHERFNLLNDIIN